MIVTLALLLSIPALAETGRGLRFEDFAVSDSYTGPSRQPILNTPSKMAYRTRIRAAAESRPNFAGAYVVSTWGCGSGCTQFVIVDPRTGYVYMPPFSTSGGETLYAFDDSKWERIDWRPNSRLLVVNGKVTDNAKEPDAHHYYVFDGRELHYLAKEKGKPYAEPVAPVATPPAMPAPSPTAEPKTGTASSLPVTFIGKWSSTYAECRAPTDGLVIIEKTKLRESELECEFTKLDHVNDMWTIIADCSGEGDRWASRLQLTINGDSLIKQYDKQPQVSLLRCP